jgi:Flp pilus assembly protein TadG
MDKFISFLRRKMNAQGMVEFALVLPLLLLLIYGIIEAGRLLFIYSTVLTSSREAARYGAAAGDITPLDPRDRYKDCAGMRAAARRIGGLAGIQDSDINIVYDRGPSTATIAHCNSSFTITGGSGTTITQGDRVVVQVGAIYRPLIPGITRFSTFPITSVTRRAILKDVEVGGTPPPPIPPKVSFVSSSQVHPESDGEIVVRVQMDIIFGKAVTVPYTLSGSAVEDKDYTITASPVVISPTELTVDILVQIIDDEMDEDDEFLVITMGNPTNGDKVAPDVHTITIQDNDDPPFVYFTASSQAQEEGEDIFINLELSAASSFDITVDFSVSGSASLVDGPDFSITGSPVTIPAESTGITITAFVVDDAMDEDDETIIVTIDDIIKGQRGSPDVHTATILDNDLPPFVFFTWPESSVEESDEEFGVQVELSAISSKNITVAFSVGGDAELDSDYSISASPVSIPAGSDTAEITITILDDGDPTEEDEKVVLTLHSPVNAILGTPDVHTATIANKVEPPLVSFDSASQGVDEVIGGKTIKVRVQLSHASPNNVRVPFSVGGTAVEGVDFDITSSPVTIPAGGAGVDIVITIRDDFLDEEDETIVITMGSPTNGIKDSPSVHTVTIADDEVAPQVFFALDSQSVVEGAGTISVSVQLSGISSLDVQVAFTQSGSAAQGSDYLISASPLLIPAGSTGADILVSLVNDTQYEPGEQLVLALGAPVNAIPGTPNTHTLLIADDDPVCPTSSSLVFTGPGGNSNTLIWTLQNPYPLVQLKLLSVGINWPNGSGANVSSISFGGSTLFSGSAPPTSLIVNSPNPLWSGTFSTNTLTYSFSKNLKSVAGASYVVTATFENCTPIIASIPSP